MLRWVSVGGGTPRFDLLGDVAALGSADSDGPPEVMLATIRAFRIRNEQAQDVLLIAIDPIRLDEAIPLAGRLEGPDSAPDPDPEADPAWSVASIPGQSLVLEGDERPLDYLLGLVRLDGWKLELRQRNGEIRYALHLLADWDVNVQPDHYPGPLFGEVTFAGPDPDGRTALTLPWPFATGGQVQIFGPVQDDVGWTAALSPAGLGGLIDSVGAALAELRDVLSFRVRIGAARQRIWEVQIALTPALSGAEGFPVHSTRRGDANQVVRDPRDRFAVRRPVEAVRCGDRRRERLDQHDTAITCYTA